ncbi:MAG: hypothetical protein ABWZ08_13965 [Pseudoxanthomonas sp.]
MNIAGRDFHDRRSHERAALDLEAMVEEIARHVPRMRAAYDTEEGFWHWFKGEVDSVRRNSRSVEEGERLTAKLRQALDDLALESE